VFSLKSEESPSQAGRGHRERRWWAEALLLRRAGVSPSSCEDSEIHEASPLSVARGGMEVVLWAPLWVGKREGARGGTEGAKVGTRREEMVESRLDGEDPGKRVGAKEGVAVGSADDWVERWWCPVSPLCFT
jgi:hypothetical protein